jgi:alanyl-tRNA synthetase
MNSNQVRKEFINFFKRKSHKLITSSPVVPLNDPTLLFTNAGMNQFKDIFLGNKEPEYDRAVNSQKCLRASGKHNDLEDVGKDDYHHTFFEMLGNWSFGDYYKEEAILWAWELLTKEWQLPKSRLYATVYKDDDEAYKLWKKVSSLPEDRILRFGEKDNFWEMGETGPCGPCSEIHIDLGEDVYKYNKPIENDYINVKGSARYIELWNLVFIQYNRTDEKTLNNLNKKYIDTGMGFERVTRVLNGKKSNYDIDIFQNIIKHIENITNKEYTNNNIVAMRVIADHIRALTFAIADGAIISNEGRNSVLRSILRRAARFGRTVLNQNEPFIYKLTDSVIKNMGDAYPEIKERENHIKKIIQEEEITFSKTIDKGLEHFDKTIKNLEKSEEKVIPGKDVFILHTQEGFPMDLTRQMAVEKGYSIDENGFKQYMEQHKKDSMVEDRFKTASKEINWIILKKNIKSDFLGYDTLKSDANITQYGWDGHYTQVICDKTPFYPNMGGQVGDKGKIFVDGNEYPIIDTIKLGDDICHIVDTHEEITFKDNHVKLVVDELRRKNIARNHTATHLLHSALRNVLGNHVTQQGSLVDWDRLRFDFSHKEKLTTEQIQQIEHQVNEQIRLGKDVDVSIMNFNEAKKTGAMALFGEKYEDDVRVITVEGFSKELCGGTHVINIRDIGYFRIISESSIAAGIRRIEAITGDKALHIIDEEKKIIDNIRSILNISIEDITERVEELKDRVKELEKENKRLKTGSVGDSIDDIVNKNAISIKDFKMVIWKFEEEMKPDEMRIIGDKLKNKLKSCVLILSSISNNKINYICMVTDDVIKNHGLKAGDIIKEVAKIAGGGGGGKPNQATAGAKDLSKLEESLSKAEDIVKRKI